MLTELLQDLQEEEEEEEEQPLELTVSRRSDPGRTAAQCSAGRASWRCVPSDAALALQSLIITLHRSQNGSGQHCAPVYRCSTLSDTLAPRLSVHKTY